MEHSYDHKKIEKKWQKVWEKNKQNQVDEDSGKPKYYSLMEFPYPSGDGLHVGHVRGFTAMDIISRYKRRVGFETLYPIGYDSFGLPAENHAIKTGVHPKVTTEKNIGTFRNQFKELGLSFDWSREFKTSDPEYYKWTQWIFLQLFRKGLAYKEKMPINWCQDCKVGLANEEVVGGMCERCGGEIEKKEKEQWMLAITKYAERLLDDLEDLDYINAAKIQQRNWIGKSEGAEINFDVKDSNEKIGVFTTRPDTLFGATYMVLAPEHPLIHKLESKIENMNKVKVYVKESVQKKEIERTDLTKEKTGVRLRGILAINPADRKEIPVFIADYVLPQYGTGAIMAVPAHDDRDFHFAIKYNLEVREVVERQPKDFDYSFVNIHDDDKSLVAENLRKLSTKDENVAPTVKLYHIPKGNNQLVLKILRENTIGSEEDLDFIEKGKNFTLEKNDRGHCVLIADIFTGDGKHINSGFLNGLNNKEAIDKVSSWLEEKKIGKREVVFKLRDWVFSRQRYWGEPIPIINCSKCGFVPVPEKDLPVELPEVEDFMPNEEGDSALAKAEDWIKVSCPNCSGDARRETDVMPQWAGSSWYFLRYIDPHNNKELVDKKKEEKWMPVDWYNGGMEHTTLHLLYSRFWHKFLFDLGVVNESEPYKKRTSHGFILGEDNEKMSKSRGNIVNPDDVIERFGADTLRMYEMFMGPFDQAITWSTDGLMGPRRFLDKLWRASDHLSNKPSINESLKHQTIKKITEDIEEMRFNTAVSSLMGYFNEANNGGSTGHEDFKTLLLLLAPFAPHITEELWEKIGEKESIHLTPWPAYDKTKTVKKVFVAVVQVNGKVRGEIEIGGLTEEEIKEKALNLDRVEVHTKGKDIKRIIYIKDKLINIVV